MHGNGPRLSAFKLSAGRRRLARGMTAPAHPRLGSFHFETKSPATGRTVREYFHRAEMSISPLLK